jgi:hypothetical protein
MAGIVCAQRSESVAKGATVVEGLTDAPSQTRSHGHSVTGTHPRPRGDCTQQEANMLARLQRACCFHYSTSGCQYRHISVVDSLKLDIRRCSLLWYFIFAHLAHTES